METLFPLFQMRRAREWGLDDYGASAGRSITLSELFALLLSRCHLCAFDRIREWRDLGTRQSWLNGSPITGASNSAAMNILNPGFLNSNRGNAAYNDILGGGANVKAAIANAAPGLMDQFTGGQTVTPNSGASYGVGQGIGMQSAISSFKPAQVSRRITAKQPVSKIQPMPLHRYPRTCLYRFANAYGAGKHSKVLTRMSSMMRSPDTTMGRHCR